MASNDLHVPEGQQLVDGAATKRVGSPGIKSVGLSYRVLFELALATEPLGVSELARRLGEGRAAVHKHLLTLRGLGVVLQAARSDRYRLGWKLVELGLAAEAQISLVAIADVPMRRLRDLCGLTVYLIQPNGERMIVSHSVASDSMIAVTIRKGLEVPLHGSAAGRVRLAFGPKDERDRVLSRQLTSLSERMLTNATEIRERIKVISERMYDATVGESPSGIHSLAAPVLDEQGSFVAAVGVIGTQVQILTQPDPAQVRQLQQCAASISCFLNSNAYERIGIEPWDWPNSGEDAGV